MIDVLRVRSAVSKAVMPEPGAPFPSRGRILSHEIEQPQHPHAQTLLKFWHTRNLDRLPHRSEIACPELKSVLPFLFLMEPVDAALEEWRYRVVGSALVERFAMNHPRGRLMSEVHHPDVVAFRQRIYREIVKSGTPHISRGKVLGIGRDFYEIETVRAPINGGGENPTWILTGMFFFN